ncbi:MAG TPA: hypothetical protein DDW52_13150, partial [Planctomycetaceae bacterium]|nr:hypothetical protein [Planctomycetaceae bacterium]
MKEFLTSKMRNPVQGVRSHRLRSTCPAWGVSSLATDRTAGDLLRGSLANPTTANSSTTKGPRGLAGELCRRRSRTANGFGWWVRGCFYVRPSEMIATLPIATSNRNYAGSGELDIQPNPLPVTRDSDVSCKEKGIANAGSSMAAGVVTGAWPGQSSDSNAVESECGLIRSRVTDRREPVVRLERWLCKAVEQSLVVSGGAEIHATTKGLTGSFSVND